MTATRRLRAQRNTTSSRRTTVSIADADRLAYLADGDPARDLRLQGGAPANPDRYHNLRAHPEVTIEAGIDTPKARAHEATGQERERLFAALAKRSPNFAEYQPMTERFIPVIVLEPTV